MTNATLQIKFQERLNVLASLDYDNFEPWQIAEAYNKARLSWTRLQLNGGNARKEGDEGSHTLTDDFQMLLVQDFDLSITRNAENIPYFRSREFPEDYLRYKRVDVIACSDCCGDRPMISYLKDVADIPILLRDSENRPDFEWGETIHSFANNEFRIYCGDDFVLSSATLVYYRKPKPVQFVGMRTPDGVLITVDVSCELKEDATEICIDLAVSILAGDTGNAAQKQRGEETVKTFS